MHRDWKCLISAKKFGYPPLPSEGFLDNTHIKAINEWLSYPKYFLIRDCLLKIAATELGSTLGLTAP